MSQDKIDRILDLLDVGIQQAEIEHQGFAPHGPLTSFAMPDDNYDVSATEMLRYDNWHDRHIQEWPSGIAVEVHAARVTPLDAEGNPIGASVPVTITGMDIQRANEQITLLGAALRDALQVVVNNLAQVLREFADAWSFQGEDGDEE